MKSILPKPQWTDQFTNAVGSLKPEFSVTEASRWAEKTYPEACDLTPTEAASIFATGLPPADVGSPE